MTIINFIVPLFLQISWYALAIFTVMFLIAGIVSIFKKDKDEQRKGIKQLRYFFILIPLLILNIYLSSFYDVGYWEPNYSIDRD